jgi:hypothetical protein
MRVRVRVRVVMLRVRVGVICSFSVSLPSFDMRTKVIDPRLFLLRLRHACMHRYNDVFCAVPVKEQDPSMTIREQELYALSATQYADERRAGRVSCAEYASALIKRARYYRYLNQWTYRSYDLFHQALETAKALDMKV